MLDVRLRSSVVRAARTRLLAVVLGGAFCAVFGVYLLWRLGGWGLNQLLYENRAFAIRNIEVQTSGVITPEQLRNWANVRPGANLLALDLAEVKRNLEYVPLIASAAVERVLPHTLRVRVTEREPVAQVNVTQLRPGGGVELVEYQLDAEGYAMRPLNRLQRSAPLFQAEAPLPVVAGANPHEVQAGRRVESPGVQAALRFIAAFDRSPMAGLADVQRIDAAAADVLVVTTGQGSVVTFGMHDFDRQLMRWREIYDAGARHQRAIASMDLAVSNNIPLRWLEGAPPPAPPRKSTKSSSSRKKHV